ncbi:proteinase R-like protein, partial [Leptotrombidium deliense]
MNSIECSEILEEIFEKNLSVEEASKLLSEKSNYSAPFYEKGELIENRYMIKFVNENAMQKVLKVIQSKSMSFDTSFIIRHEYAFGIGIAVSMSSQSVDIFRRLKEVQYVQQDSLVKIADNKKDYCTKCLKREQKDSEWCLARSANPNATNDFAYPKSAGKGITICVVGKQVNINICVNTLTKIFVQIVKMNRVVIHHKVSIISMSLGGGRNQLEDDAVEKVYENGKLVVAAAGNEADDACLTSPGGSEYAFTVAASDPLNALASFSNYG